METLIEEVQLKLDNRFLSYADQTLTGGPTLCILLKREVDFTAGTLTALLPRGIDEPRRYNFEGGGLRISARNAVADEIARFLSTNDGHLCVVPDFMATGAERIDHAWRTVWGMSGQPRIARHNEEVYYVLFPGDQEDYILDILRFAEAPGPFIVVLTSTGTTGKPLAPKSPLITVQELDAWATHVTTVFLAAYDNESFLVWRRNLDG